MTRSANGDTAKQVGVGFNVPDALILIALLIVVTIIALPVVTYPLGRDQGEFATLGRGILNGRVPYKELWNPKPPAVFYIYALAIRLFGQSTEALRLIDFFIVPPICLCLYWLGKRLANRRVGLWSALLLPVFYFTETFWTLTQNDGIVLLPMVLAVVAMVKLVEMRHKASAFSFQQLVVGFLTGALCGYIVWFKYPFALFGVMIVIGYIWIRASTRPAIPLQKQDAYIFISFMLGGLVVIVGGASYLMSIGAWDDLVTSAQVTSQYTLLTFNWQDFSALLQTALGYRWQQWGLLWVLAGVWVVVKLRAPGAEVQAPESRPQSTALLTLWFITGLTIMLVQAKAYDYHWLPVLPPLVLMAGEGLDHVLSGVMTRLSRISVGTTYPTGRLRTISSLPYIVILLLLPGIMLAGIWPRTWAYLTGKEDKIAYYGRFVAGAAEEFNAADSLRVSTLLRERVVPGDSLYIWGFRPEVYFMSGLNPGSRFFFHFPLVADWYPQAWRKENVDTLWASLPPYVLVLQVDYMPWVIGNDKDSNTLLQEYTDLNNWLIFNYERETQIGNFFVWKRKS
jgi:hypothetical protein